MARPIFSPLFAYFRLAARSNRHSAINTLVIAEGLLAVFTYWTWATCRHVRQSVWSCWINLFLVSLAESFLLVLDSFCWFDAATVFWTDQLWETFGEILPFVGWPERCHWYVSVKFVVTQIQWAEHDWHVVHQVHETFEEMRVKQEKSSVTNQNWSLWDKLSNFVQLDINQPIIYSWINHLVYHKTKSSRWQTKKIFGLQNMNIIVSLVNRPIVSAFRVLMVCDRQQTRKTTVTDDYKNH